VGARADIVDPLGGTPWSNPATVDGFVRSAPNATLLDFASRVRHLGGRVAVDIGCGAGRNLVPLVAQGWRVLGLDLSWPMLDAARRRLGANPGNGAAMALAPMERLPVRSTSADLVIAHGIWNLARTTSQFRAAVAEAARIARPGGALFVFTFSRHTLPPEAVPVPGEPYVYTQFSGGPQVFLTREQMLAEMQAAGFVPDDAVPLTEHNLPRPGQVQPFAGPVIFEAAFRRED
jgi:SAM-dependent methyltransferase